MLALINGGLTPTDWTDGWSRFDLRGSPSEGHMRGKTYRRFSTEFKSGGAQAALASTGHDLEGEHGPVARDREVADLVDDGEAPEGERLQAVAEIQKPGH